MKRTRASVLDALVGVAAGGVVSADGVTWRVVPISVNPADVDVGRNPTIAADRQPQRLIAGR